MGSIRKRGRRKTDRKIEAHYELMKVVAESNHERMFEYYVDWDEASVSSIVNGKEKEEIVYPDFRDNIDYYMKDCSAESRSTFKKMFEKCLVRPTHTGAQLEFIGAEKKPELTRMYMVSIADLEGNISVVAGVMLKIDDKKGQLDSLTGVYNHIAFENHSTPFIRESKSNVLFVMIDVDDFKIINDTLGHNVGDMVLSQTAQILKEFVGERGIVGRLGGDEFAALIYGIEGMTDLSEFCRQLTSSLKRIIFDMEYSASIGIAAVNGRNLTFKDLYYEADQAMYYSKKNGKNQITIYDEIKEHENSKMVAPVIYGEYAEANLLSEYEKYSDDESPEYILVVDEKSNRILFANKAAIKASIMPPAAFDSFIKTTMPENFIGELLRSKEQGYRITVFSGKEHPDNVLAKIFGDKQLLIKLTHMDKNGYRKLRIMDLSSISQLNESMRLISSFKSCMKNFVRAFMTKDERSDFGACLQIVKDFYNADLATIVYGENEIWDSVQEVHNDNADTMAKLLMESVSTGSIMDFSILFNESRHVHIGNIKSIENEYPGLFMRLVDTRIWSVFAVKMENEGRVLGTIMLFNPRANSGEMNVLDMVGLSISDTIACRYRRASYEYRLNYDEVTGLRKRKNVNNLGESYLEYNLASMGVFATDVIRLGWINDNFGYSSGNKLLKKISEIVSGVFNGYDIYRYDNDEIVVFCKNIEKKDFVSLVRLVRERLDELDDAVSTGYSWTQKPNLSQQIEEVRKMYTADMERRLRAIEHSIPKKVEKNLISEVNAGKFFVYYQPKVDSTTGETVGAEALLRYNDDIRGLIGPVHFIHLLEENGCSHIADLFVLEQVCKIQHERLKEKKRAVPISVNFSKTTLEYSLLLTRVKDIIDKYELPPRLIQIEITESVCDMEHVAVADIARSLITMGFDLAMDDFGTMYSNLEMLFRFPFAIAKIDRSLVKDVIVNEKSKIMLKHLTAMIAELGIVCVAEGAESRCQVEQLQKFGCNIIQGYYYSKPIADVEFFEKFVEKKQEPIKKELSH